MEEVEVLGIEAQVWFLESMEEEEGDHCPLSIVDNSSEVFPPLLVAWANWMLIGQWMISESA